MVANQTSGRAIADIAGVYFYDTSTAEPTITNQTTFSALLASSSWYSVLTIKGTVNCSQDAPSVTAIHVDQFDPSIGITSEPGDFTFEAFLPDMTSGAIAKWLEEGAITKHALNFRDSSTAASAVKRTGYGYDLNGKQYYRMVLIETKTGDFFLFTRAQLSFSFGQEDKTFGFRLNGQIVSPSESVNKMLYAFTNVGHISSASEAQSL